MFGKHRHKKKAWKEEVTFMRFLSLFFFFCHFHFPLIFWFQTSWTWFKYSCYFDDIYGSKEYDFHGNCSRFWANIIFEGAFSLFGFYFVLIRLTPGGVYISFINRELNLKKKSKFQNRTECSRYQIQLRSSIRFLLCPWVFKLLQLLKKAVFRIWCCL